MRCLMCHKPIRHDSFDTLFQKQDVLCADCRESWKRIEQRYRFEGHDAFVLYAYEGGFSECLLQYKELCDEALKPAFLMPDRTLLRRMYRGRTLLLLPSSEENRTFRGFSHLKGIFEILDLPMLEPFEKTDPASQKHLHRNERAAMASGIRLKEGAALPKRIVLADDVITTGSTMKGALAALPKGMDIRIFACGLTERKPQNQTGKSGFRSRMKELQDFLK